MKNLDVNRAKGFAICAVFLFSTLLSSYCLAGIQLGPIRGPVSFDPWYGRHQSENNPSWNPDGSRIVWRWGNGYTAVGDPGTIVTIGRGPDNPVKNYAGWDCDYPDWSPCSEWVVYAKSRVGEAYLERISMETGEVVPIPTPVEFVKDPHWSPCCDSIAYIGGLWRPEADRIYITDPLGSDHNPITPDPSEETVINDLSWSPNCDDIVFTQSEEESLFVVDVVTEDITEIPIGLLPYSVVWATKNSILFDSGGAIYDYQFDTQTTTQLTFGSDYLMYEDKPAWDQLGDWHPTAGLVFSSSRGTTARWDCNIYTAIPEPGTVMLLGLGGLMLRRRRKR